VPADHRSCAVPPGRLLAVTTQEFLDESATAAAPPVSSPRLDATTVATILGFALPVAAYFWLIHHYAVNVVFLDQWGDVTLLGRSYAHTLSFGDLWAQHGEQRMLLPNLVMLLLGHATHLNVVYEEYLSALMLCGATAFLIVAHKRRSPERRLIAYCPVAILMLSLVQAESALFGFQFAWYAVLLWLGAMLFLLDRPVLSGPFLAAAVATAVAGSLSSIQGLLLWPCGLLLLYLRGRPASRLVIWSAAGLAMGAAYAPGYSTNKGVPPGLSGVDLPVQAVHSFFEVIGSVLGIHLGTPSGEAQPAVLLFGIVIVAVSLYAVITRGVRRDTSSGSPIGVALICFGLLYALAFANARAFAGPPTASSSQYTTFTLLIVVGCYLALLDPALRSWASASRRSRLGAAVGLVVLAIMALQLVFGEVNGVRAASAFHQRQTGVALAIADIRNVPDPILQGAVGGYGIRPAVIRSDARVLADHGLSFFDDPRSVLSYERQAAVVQKQGLYRYTAPPPTNVALPSSGEALRGRALVDAQVRQGMPVRSVGFRLLGPGGTVTDIGSGTHTKYGWLLQWDTTAVPNGSYRIESMVVENGGGTATSAPVSISIANP
jgi:hypothetical protein